MKNKEMTMDEIWMAAANKALPFFVPKKVKQGLISVLLSLLAS